MFFNTWNLLAFWEDQMDPKSALGGPKPISSTGCRSPSHDSLGSGFLGQGLTRRNLLHRLPRQAIAQRIGSTGQGKEMIWPVFDKSQKTKIPCISKTRHLVCCWSSISTSHWIPLKTSYCEIFKVPRLESRGTFCYVAKICAFWFLMLSDWSIFVDRHDSKCHTHMHFEAIEIYDVHFLSTTCQ